VKRSAVLVAAVLLLAVAIPAVASKGKGSPGGKKQTFNVHLTDLAVNDVKGDGPTPGDVETFSINVVNGSTETPAGHGYCVVQAGGFATCTSVAFNSSGSVVSVWDAPESATTVVAAITGGTGAYRNARGTVTFTQQGADTTRFPVVARVIG
jgi:hypothetical protein